MNRPLTRLLGVLAAMIAMTIWLIQPAVAEPAPGPIGANPGFPTLPLPDLGSSNAIPLHMHRDNATTTIAFAVPDGMAPETMQATLEIPIELRFGLLTVRQGGLTISRIPVPAEGTDQVVIPLTGTPVFGGWATLTLTMTALPLDEYCWDPMSPIRLVNGSVTFAGTESPPTTVADFLPPVLRTLTIGLPRNPSLPESNAAVQLAAAVAMRFGGQNPVIQMAPLADGTTVLPPPGPLERQIVVKEGPDKGVSLQGGAGMPSLLVTGPGAEIENQLRLLADDALQYALSRKATTSELVTNQAIPGDRATLRELKISNLDDEAIWPRVSVELDQTKFGRQVGGITVHLIGSYTPIAGNFGGEVLIMVGDRVLDQWPAEGSAKIDRVVSVPRELLGRSTNLTVNIHTTGDPGNCGDYLPMDLRIDDSSTVEVTSAVPSTAPVPPGFQSFPQVGMPNIQIGIGADAFGDTARAAQIAVGLQRSSPGVALATTVTTLEQALGSTDSAILVSSQGWQNPDVVLPFHIDGDSKSDVTVEGLDSQGKTVTLSLDPAIRFGSLQTVFDGKRSLLVATSNESPQQIDELLRWLAGEPGRWSGLNGRAIVSVPGSDPVVIPNPPLDVLSASEEKPAGISTPGWVWEAAGVIVVLAAAGALAILLKARSQQSTKSE